MRKVNRVIKKIVDYAIYTIEPEIVILFGSYAKGNQNVHSDIDLLLISENTYKRKETIGHIHNYAGQYSMKVDVLLLSRKEIKDELSKENSFIKAIYNDWQIIYYKNKNRDKMVGFII